ncbi:hypothetical protein CHS0354_028411 [Potamilus streckersoni]|uniref:Uncharacterized protein n=1 Tax=Potamilus streckersoni TaxID=2493646 RepID=A0AAE0VGS2_9BIVA|nr:hypothetical protein CHS0354_028411 [Potamilus streckersoni]
MELPRPREDLTNKSSARVAKPKPGTAPGTIKQHQAQSNNRWRKFFKTKDPKQEEANLRLIQSRIRKKT